jgi:DNA-binding transcriptional regulator LsrR (DeoR family)
MAVNERASVRTDESTELLRLLTRVAHLYHTRGLRQGQIAERLHLSQSRVSRLLTVAREEGIIRTIVVSPPGLHADIAEELEQRYDLRDAHVIDVEGDDEQELTRELGATLASILETTPWEARRIGFTSWSRALRAMVSALHPLGGAGAQQVVEMLGDVGPPSLQHEAAGATQRLAELTRARAVFLRAPGVVASASVRDALLEQDGYAREALLALDGLDLALVGVGNCRVVPPLTSGDNFFTHEELERVVAQGAVGEINLRFLDAEGRPVLSELDERVIGVTLKQIQNAKRTLAVAGGPSKHAAIRATLVGGWVDTLVTDVGTAHHLLAA